MVFRSSVRGVVDWQGMGKGRVSIIGIEKPKEIIL